MGKFFCLIIYSLLFMIYSNLSGYNHVSPLHYLPLNILFYLITQVKMHCHDRCTSFVLQAHILEFGLTVHEKFVPQDMRPLHKKLVDQFHLMKSSLGIQVHISSQILSDFPSCLSCTHSSVFPTLWRSFQPMCEPVRSTSPTEALELEETQHPT